ncbi:DUF4870 domain-containing protein [Nocardioides sp.]|uniref:DUF4870 domain-containing protein n=1 Tax=Nocardioides sp. TaxID=35761 RepID=UPI00286D820F|nr:DUF4870 domain-containing protein [Nocardioides sp.]
MSSDPVAYLEVTMSQQFPTDPTDPYTAEQSQPAAPATPQGYAVQQQPLSPTQERTMGAVAHGAPLVAMVLSAGLLGFVGSLVVYLMYKDRGPFVRAHAANSLNVQITTGIILLVSLPLMLVLVGFLTFGLAFVFAFVVHVLGAIKAYNGEWWNPPMTPKFVK